jgi:hypothetical protein
MEEAHDLVIDALLAHRGQTLDDPFWRVVAQRLAEVGLTRYLESCREILADPRRLEKARRLLRESPRTARRRLDRRAVQEGDTTDEDVEAAQVEAAQVEVAAQAAQVEAAQAAQVEAAQVEGHAGQIVAAQVEVDAQAAQIEAAQVEGHAAQVEAAQVEAAQVEDIEAPALAAEFDEAAFVGALAAELGLEDTEGAAQVEGEAAQVEGEAAQVEVEAAQVEGTDGWERAAAAATAEAARRLQTGDLDRDREEAQERTTAEGGWPLSTLTFPPRRAATPGSRRAPRHVADRSAASWGGPSRTSRTSRTPSGVPGVPGARVGRTFRDFRDFEDFKDSPGSPRGPWSPREA